METKRSLGKLCPNIAVNSHPKSKGRYLCHSLKLRQQDLQEKCPHLIKQDFWTVHLCLKPVANSDYQECLGNKFKDVASAFRVETNLAPRTSKTAIDLCLSSVLQNISLQGIRNRNILDMIHISYSKDIEQSRLLAQQPHCWVFICTLGIVTLVM